MSKDCRFYPRLAALALLVVLTILMPAEPVVAQDTQPNGAVYVVQPGDNLYNIAQRFGVSMQEIQEANNISDPNNIKVGDRLLIPGLEGIQGVLTTQTIPLGESLNSLSRRYATPADMLVRLNHLVSPQEIYAGMSLIIPESEQTNPYGQRATLLHGQSMLELAVTKNTSPWSLAQVNQLAGSWAALPGDVLRVPGEPDSGPGAMPEAISTLEINALPLLQGQTVVIRLDAAQDITISGFLGNYPLHFFNQGENHFVALQGIHALQKPGNYLFSLQGAFADGTLFELAQFLNVQEGDFYYEKINNVDPATIDPANTQPEEKLWFSLASIASSEKLWQDTFAFPAPIDFYDCYTSWYGARRSYNDSPYNYFHTGLDVCTGAGTEIYAAAPGVVVLAEALTVRGNAVMLDHGWGVFTAYMHLSEIRVKTGDRVEAGQLIGISGGTGRVAGPHLHWEVLVGGVQVEPLDWLTKQYP